MNDNLRGSLAMTLSMAAFAAEDALLKFAIFFFWFNVLARGHR